MDSGLASRLWVRIGGLVSVVLCGVAVTACGGSSSPAGNGPSTGNQTSTAKPRPGGTLELSQGEEITTLYPPDIYLGEDQNVDYQIFEPLFREDSDEKFVPWLLEKYEMSSDATKWTFHLRHGVEFSNGQPLTAADVVWTLENAKTSELNASVVEDFKSVKASDPYTVIFETKESFPELPETLAEWRFVILPEDLAGESQKEFESKPIGTGPFMLDSWKKGEAVTLVKNPHYWKAGQPYLEKVVFRTVPNPQSRVAQLRGGQLSLIFAPPTQELSSLEQSGFTIQETPKAYTWLLTLNMRKAPFEDPRLREAVSLSLDREAMVQTALSGRGEPAGSWVAPVSQAYSASFKPPAQDLALAKELVDEAVKGGAKPSFTLLVPNELQFWTTAVQVAQQNLEEAGFSVSIKKADGNSIYTLAGEGDFEAAAVYFNIQVPSPVEAYSFYVVTEGEWSGPPLGEVEQLLSAAKSEPNATKRDAMWNKITALTVRENGVVPVAFSRSAWARATNLVGVQLGALGVPFLNEAGFTE